jgi:hypothetical protein
MMEPCQAIFSEVSFSPHYWQSHSNEPKRTRHDGVEETSVNDAARAYGGEHVCSGAEAIYSEHKRDDPRVGQQIAAPTTLAMFRMDTK